MSVSIKRWLKFIILGRRSKYILFFFFYMYKTREKTLPYLQAGFSEFTSAFGESTQMVQIKHQKCNRPFSVKKEGRKILQKNYHHLKVCPTDGCFRVTKNLGEHFRSKMHKLKPGPDYYQLL